MKKLTLLLTLLMIWGNFTQAQIISDFIDPSFQNTGILRSNEMVKYSGSVFLNDDFIDGVIISNKQEVNIPIKYDAFHGDIYTILNGSETPINKSVINKFKLGDRVFEKFKGNFYEVLADGDYKLYVKHEVKLVEGKQSSGYGSEKQNQNKLVKSESYFLFHDDKLTEIKNKKSLESLPAKFSQILKDNKLNFKKADDLVAAVEKLNA